jgi:hypothetical protein
LKSPLLNNSDILRIPASLKAELRFRVQENVFAALAVRQQGCRGCFHAQPTISAYAGVQTL